MATQSEAALEESLIKKLVEGGYERVRINDKNLDEKLELINRKLNFHKEF